MAPLVAVTGVNGQLGWSIQQLQEQYQQYNFVFADREQLDLSNPDSIRTFFKEHHPNYFINCAAYTAVDKAENEQELAYKINAEAVSIIAQECKRIGTRLITISTDYVFDGNGTSPYKTDHPAKPINYYGYSKWMGEQLALENNPHTVIIRTSWVYCEHGNNFVKTMLRLMKEREELKVVSDQIGSPTYAPDLAKAILNMLSQLEVVNKYGIYHYSNTGVISWFDFATAIKEIAHMNCNILPIPSAQYPTPAKRPSYSVMDTSTLQDTFHISIPAWRDSLEVCIDKLK